MISLQRLHRGLPGCFTDMLDPPEVLFIVERNALPANSANTNLLPNRDMQRQLPDAVCGRNRAGSGGFGVDSIEDFHQRRAVPGLAIESAVQLVNDAYDLRHSTTWCRFLY